MPWLHPVSLLAPSPRPVCSSRHARSGASDVREGSLPCVWDAAAASSAWCPHPRSLTDNYICVVAVQVVQVNCFRTFEQPDDPTAPPYDPEDDEPILETGWPHLQLVYALLLKALDQKAITADVFLRIAGFEVRATLSPVPL